MEGHYGIGVVDHDGQARFVTFSLTTSTLQQHAYVGRARLEDYLDIFCAHVRRLFVRRQKKQLSMFCIFDGTDSRLPWHVPLNREYPEKMREFLTHCRSEVRRKVDQNITIEQLRTVLQPPYEDWGTFEAPGRNAPSLSFAYEERCNKAILANPLLSTYQTKRGKINFRSFRQSLLAAFYL
ncbi:hypothetical protein BK665_18340 [Pseudomonas frederiksbergensis]|uniref:Uncharacterized protein n=2 Tax=Pseudomonas frederiksbergensis TaxID=104087 RepID=A0A423KG83_9PSED|nr:hypothetical protein BK665_18340 [Pseudomonas frederiksbergensis]